MFSASPNSNAPLAPNQRKCNKNATGPSPAPSLIENVVSILRQTVASPDQSTTPLSPRIFFKQPLQCKNYAFGMRNASCEILSFDLSEMAQECRRVRKWCLSLPRQLWTDPEVATRPTPELELGPVMEQFRLSRGKNDLRVIGSDFCVRLFR
jgi:hypothetical protein